MCVEGERESKRDFMMNMDALFSRAYLHREPSAPCQCITCSSEPSPGQQGVEEVVVVVLVVAGIRRGYGLDGRGRHWGQRRRRLTEVEVVEEVARLMSPSAGGECCSQMFVSSHRGNLLNNLLNKIVKA